MKTIKNRQDLNQKARSFNFQINEKGEMLTYDKKFKKKHKIGQLKSIDQAPKDEIEQAKKFYGIK